MVGIDARGSSPRPRMTSKTTAWRSLAPDAAALASLWRIHPKRLRWLVAAAAVLSLSYMVIAHEAMHRARELMRQSQAAMAPLPRNPFLWDSKPEWRVAREEASSHSMAAVSMEPLLQVWLPGSLAVGLGLAWGAAVSVPRARAPSRPCADWLDSVRANYRRSVLFGSLGLGALSLSASEFLARWRPSTYPPKWATWLEVVSPTPLLWTRAALPLCLGTMLAIVCLRVFRAARVEESSIRDFVPRSSLESPREALAAPDSGTTPWRRFRLRAAMARIRTTGTLLAGTAAALFLTMFLREARGFVPDGRFDPELVDLYLREMGLQSRTSPALLIGALAALSVGVLLAILAPRLASAPWRWRHRADAGRCGCCGALPEPNAEQCWDCGEAVRCAACHHALRADQDLCPECGRPAKRP